MPSQIRPIFDGSAVTVETGMGHPVLGDTARTVYPSRSGGTCSVRAVGVRGNSPDNGGPGAAGVPPVTARQQKSTGAVAKWQR